MHSWYVNNLPGGFISPIAKFKFFSYLKKNDISTIGFFFQLKPKLYQIVGNKYLLYLQFP